MSLTTDVRQVRAWLRGLSLRSKIVITVVGAALALLGGSSWLSFRYWRGEVTAAAERQALLAAASVRGPVEAALAEGGSATAQRSLRRLAESAPITAARVYDADGRIVLSADPAEAGRRDGAVWLPSVGELPADGLARTTESGEAVRAFLPLRVSGGRILEVTMSIGPIEAAMDRGARLGMVLLIASLLVVGMLVLGLFEREVVAPLHRAEQLAEEQRQRLERQAGLAEVGEMAAEMAHEFKRPLAAIRSAMALSSRSTRWTSGARGC